MGRVRDDVTQAGEPSPPAQRGRTEIEVGDRIGRYVVLGRLGAGAMGIVYSAYDQQLDRRVALKLLQLRSGVRSNAGARLLREARALARLAHPNVVTIYDVGLHAGQVFLAMQHIAGRTLAAWLREDRARDHRATLAVFEAAGRGLAAVHDAGMIHRDFKPDNVMIGSDGLVRVMDFGLANLEAFESDSTEPGDAPEPASEQRLTRTGAVLGTPAYMAPEQFRGHDVTARSDQFGFCVALHEALYGRPPFVGETYAELAAAVAEGRVVPALRGSKVPGWLRAIVLRGLSRSPSDRYASMHELLAALARGGRRRRRIAAISLTTTLALGVALSLGVEQRLASAAAAACVREGDQIDALWHAEQRERIERAFAATGLDFAVRAGSYVGDELDAVADEWRSAATSACRAGKIEQRWTTDIQAKASWCLLDREAELAATIALLEQADAGVVAELTQSLAELGSPRDCIDDALLSAAPSPPEGDARDTIQALRVREAEARALAFAGRERLALEQLLALERDAASVDWPPLHATIALDEAVAHARLDEFALAEQAGRRAYRIAARIGSWDLACAAAIQVSAAASRQGAFERSLEWLDIAEIANVHAVDPQGLLDIARIEQRALHFLLQDDGAAARASAEDLLARREALFGPMHPAVADSLKWLSAVEWMAGNYEAARRHAERGVAIREATLGPRHPMLFPQLSALAKVLVYVQDDHAAIALYRRLLAFEREDDESTAHVHYDLATFGSSRGDHAFALEHHVRVRLLFAPIFPADDSRSIGYADDEGVAWVEVGRPRMAEALLRRQLSHEHEEVDRFTRFQLAQLLLDEYGRAAAAEARALLEPVPALEPIPEVRAAVLLELAELALLERRHADAATLLEQAREQLAASERPRLELGEAELSLARGEDARPRLLRIATQLDAGQVELALAERAKLELRLAGAFASLPSPTRDELARARELSERGRSDLAAAPQELGAWRATLARRR
jgi:hypothetical protein